MTSRKRHICLVLLTVLSGLAAPVSHGQRYVVSETSELWIEGTSTVNSFECEAVALEFDYDVPHVIQGSGFTVPGVSLLVPVRQLDCQNRRMNRDLQDALKADDYPQIRLDVYRLELVPEARADTEQTDSPTVRVHGVMTLAGSSRDVVIDLDGWLDDELRLHGVGKLDVKMTDFGVDPPTALFGLVKAHDDITIHFHLMADPKHDTSTGMAGFDPSRARDVLPVVPTEEATDLR